MALFLQILTTVIFPVFALIGIGVLMDRLFPIDVQTLSKFNFYLFLPAILFVALLKSELNPALFGTVAGFTLTQLVLLLGISGLLFNTKPFKP
ncbi:MAG: AEC family transporter, partial [Chloroflexi bacterium]